MKPYKIFIVVQPGLEEMAEREIVALGYHDLERIRGGFFLTGHQSTVIKLNLGCRCISRVLIEIAEFEARSFSQLEKQFAQVQWRDYISEQNICIRVNSYQSELYHEKAIEERLIASLAGCLHRKITVVGSPDEENTQLISIYAKHDIFTIRMDTSGAHLHKRGYGIQKEAAPLRETLACAMLYAMGWDQTTPPLCDPMCGSGTILIEAALMAKQVPLCEFREFSFQKWSIYQPEVFKRVRAEFLGRIKTNPKLVFTGSDLDDKAISSAIVNAQKAGVDDLIDFQIKDMQELDIDKNYIIVTNPPWGKRMGMDSIQTIWKALHDRADRGQPVYLILPELGQRDFPYPYTTLLRLEAGGIKVKFIRMEV